MTPSKEQLQRTFDKVAKHLLKQKRASITERGRCQYRLGELSCAAGCLIPDELYSQTMEGASISAVLGRFPELREVPEIDHCDELLTSLQRVHDNNHTRAWRGCLEAVAHGYDLSTAVLAEGQ